MDNRAKELIRIIAVELQNSGRIQVYQPEGDDEYLDVTIDEPNFRDHTEWRLTIKGSP